VYLIAIGWLYVAVMMAVAEATSSSGSLLGAFFTLVLYGVLPLSIVLYLVAAPARRAARRLRESQALPSTNPDGGSHAAGDPVAPVREEP
jgi:membrane protein implicated in regulation of membrane protease activity